jgi:hypothetical protein
MNRLGTVLVAESLLLGRFRDSSVALAASMEQARKRTVGRNCLYLAAE